MNLRSITRRLATRCLPITFCLATLAIASPALAQIGDDDTGPPTEEPTTQFPATGGGGGGGQTIEDNNTPVDFDDSASLNLGATEDDNRNRGFIGATAPYVSERNFVGSASLTFGVLAEDATFGGGVNGTTVSAVPNGGGTGGGRGGFGGAGGFGAGQTSGNIIRGNLRSRLRPAFAAPRVPTGVTVGRFNSNFLRQPGTQAMVGRYQVSIQNKTAFLTGFVSSKADASRLERQLRLQPGVYKIVNQLQVAQ